MFDSTHVLFTSASHPLGNLLTGPPGACGIQQLMLILHPSRQKSRVCVGIDFGSTFINVEETFLKALDMCVKTRFKKVALLIQIDGGIFYLAPHAVTHTFFFHRLPKKAYLRTE